MELDPVSPDFPCHRQPSTVRRLTEQELKRAIEVYQSGARVDEVAALFGVHRHTMSGRLKDAGVQLRFAALTPAQIIEALDLYQNGWSIARVAKHFGKNPRAIHYNLEKAGIPRRDSHGREREA
jgi:transposase-like protein